MRRQKSLQKSGVKRSENDMEAWMYDVVCMMSGTATEGMICYNRTMPNIKQEVDNPATPTQNYQVCSPTTTLQNQEVICTKMDVPPDYGGGGGGGGSAGNGNGGGGSGSPGSPEMHHCSSTTQPLGTPEEGIKEEDMMPRRLCLVCGDIASGFHYGVASCEACKAFFKRTIQASNFTGNIEYTCPANGECEINKRRRKACQACRFQKCLRQGMLKEGVRLDRVRGGRQKYRRSTDPYIPVKTATLEVSVASGGSGEQINNKMVEALAACEPDILQVSNLSHTLDTDQRILGQMADLYDRELVGTIGWAKQIPGFSSLALNDQMRLLQSTWAEILTFSLAWRSVPNNGRLWFAQDFSLDERQARECHCIELYTHCIQIVERIQRLGLIKEEYYVLKALILANSDARSDEPQALYHFRDAILNSLSDCVAAVRPGQALRATQNMFLILPSLRQADGIVRKFWSSVCRTGKVPMNKLFVEMLEAAYYR
ncbi:PREDICTED: steroid hormone receptor ERR1 isoform X3 [Polistes dominula]|uniref:Steroid hormone receptor ERR1 isoform X3 n=1 Tax=Polistes dominula TaxID=743375 RepID=A0ABM1HUQ6_POLDO|nr:PREDICTED: steroid hormone receptor ERR1 isoform X3 [Polistes dominula]